MTTNRDKLQDKLLLADEIEVVEELLQSYIDNPENIIRIGKGGDSDKHIWLDTRSTKAVLSALTKLVATYKKEDAEFNKLVDKLIK